MLTTHSHWRARSAFCIGLALLVLQSQPSRADDSSLSDQDRVYYAAPITALEILGEKLTSEHGRVLENYPTNEGWMLARCYLLPAENTGASEALVLPKWMLRARGSTNASSMVACSTAEAIDAEGVIVLPTEDGPIRLRFRIPKSAWQASGSAGHIEYSKVQDSYFSFFAQRRIPGSAWFRYRSNLARAQFQAEEDRFERRDNLGFLMNSPNYRHAPGNLDLQYVRDYATAPMQSVHEVPELKLPMIDWETIPQLKPTKTDRLAGWIPGDQYGLFFDSFQNLTYAVDYAAQDFITQGQLDPPQEQLGLVLDELARLVGPQVVESIAVTGSDPNLSFGSDVAVILEPKPKVGIEALQTLMETQLKLVVRQRAGSLEDGDVQGVQFSRFFTADHSLNCYLMNLEDALILSNSLGQLKHLIAVRKGQVPNLESQPEYLLFRGNFPLDPTQSGLLIVTRLAAQKWASPGHRIGAVRRMSARAALQDLHAAKTYAALANQPFDLAANAAPYQELLGTVELDDRDWLQSSQWGNLQYLTPSIDRNIEEVTDFEAKSYRVWKSRQPGYFSHRYGTFAFQFRSQKESWDANCTVFPCQKETFDELFFGLFLDAQVDTRYTDPHPESMLHLSFAYNRESQAAQFIRMIIQQNGQDIEFDEWFHNSISLYIDDGEYWDKNPVRPESVLFDFQNDLPLGIRWQLQSKARPELILTFMKKLIRQFLPDAEVDVREYRQVPYVELNAKNPALDCDTLFLVVTAQQVLVSPSEALLKRAVDRELDEVRPDEELLDIRNWPGRSINLQLKGRFSQFVDLATYAVERELLSAIPILNEWRHHSDLDPEEFHQRRWFDELPDGTYTWDEQQHSMSSEYVETMNRTLPISKEAAQLGPLGDFSSVSFGVDVEQDALHFRVRMQRASP